MLVVQQSAKAFRPLGLEECKKEWSPHREGAGGSGGNAAGGVGDLVGERQRPKLREADRQVNAHIGGHASLAPTKRAY